MRRLGYYTQIAVISETFQLNFYLDTLCTVLCYTILFVYSKIYYTAAIDKILVSEESLKLYLLNNFFESTIIRKYKGYKEF